MASEDLDLTIQYYRPEHTDATPVFTQDVLRDGTRLVVSVTREVRWYNPSTASSLPFVIGEHCFEWNRDIPKLKDNARVHVISKVIEWEDDVATRDDELWALPDLEVFDHSRLHRLLELQPTPLIPVRSREPSNDPLPSLVTPHSSMAIGQKRSSERESDPLTIANKRQKLNESSLCDILPEPHFLPCRSTTDDPDYQPPSLKLEFSPISPHTLASAMEYMEDPYTRLAWIIPVRGRLQWEGATAASIVSNHESGSPTGSSDQLPSINRNSELSWTRDALSRLWGTLKDLRELGRFGSLSLSFHVALPATSRSSMEPYSYVGSHKQSTISMSTFVSSNTPVDEPQTWNAGSPMPAVDYIKVYHDAKYTKHLRAVLRAWSYKTARQKIRLLKEAKLVLVDEVSRGLVIC